MKRYAQHGPEVVAEVTYLEWTDDGPLRHLVYQGLREDKAPTIQFAETP